MLRLLLCTAALTMPTSMTFAAEGVPYSEHGDITGQSDFTPNDIEPAAGEAMEDQSAGVPYSEHGEIK